MEIVLLLNVLTVMYKNIVKHINKLGNFVSNYFNFHNFHIDLFIHHCCTPLPDLTSSIL